MSYYKQAYFALLPIPLTISTIFGIVNAMDYGCKTKDKTQIESFSGMVGFTSIGMITGIMYPISFPMLAGYTVLQRGKQE